MANDKDLNTSEKYYKHLSYNDRCNLQKLISQRSSLNLKSIAEIIGKDPSTISKEVKRNRIFVINNYNRLSWANSVCIHMSECHKNNICEKICSNKLCKKCLQCTLKCPDFEERKCSKLSKFPWCCNGCSKLRHCHLNKYFYYADKAEIKYQENLRESRKGINLSESELIFIDRLITPLIRKGQSLEHIFATHADEIPCSIRTIYTYIEKQYLSPKNIDLRRKVKYKSRNINKNETILKRKAKIGRTYDDYINYINNNPNVDIVQMDTVEGIKGEPTLLTLHFVRFHFMLAFIIPNKKSDTIVAVFNYIQDVIGINEFKRLFPVILTDNGSEFCKPECIEFDPITGESRTRIFYCHPMSSWEKGAIESNHRYIRYYFPRGVSFAHLTQKDVNMMLSHINSTKRKSTDKCSPYDLAKVVFGESILDAFQIYQINPDDVILTSQLLK